MKCLDTYALIEIHQGNPKFTSILNEDIIIADLTFAEFYGLIYKKHDKITADYWKRKLEPFCKPVLFATLIKAMQFRVDSRKNNISFFDAVGYTFALENYCSFLTGDKEFENMKGVKFIKK